MEFINIFKDSNCNCLENSKEDFASHYAIKTMKESLRVQDFNSYWEKGKRPNSNDCKEICSYKGVSISIFNEETKEEVVNIFKELFPLAPRYKPYLKVIKLYDSSGVVKHTPNEVNIHHYDFYKSDTFEFSKVDIIEIKELH